MTFLVLLLNHIVLSVFQQINNRETDVQVNLINLSTFNELVYQGAIEAIVFIGKHCATS